MTTQYRVDDRVSHTAAPADAPEYGTLRLITATDNGPTLTVEWDHRQGRTQDHTHAELHHAPRYEADQAVPALATGVRVQRRITHLDPVPGARPRQLIERGTYQGILYGGHTVLWDGAAHPEFSHGTPDFRVLHPGHLAAERRMSAHAIGDRIETIHRGQILGGRVLEIRRTSGRLGVRQARIRLDGQPGTLWRDVLTLYPLHGAQLAAECARRSLAGQPHQQAVQVYYGDYRP
ncbi:hypothetical protein ACIOJE_35110 [Kitasatospora sp. NPDC087861]|uniref:hypothetical protein n=1 Tax=Kitasatospora sp. NPDC087861 TaxID=3364070 RepID=UPI0038153972